MTVNHDVVGSSPTGRAINKQNKFIPCAFLFINKDSSSNIVSEL